MVNLDLNTPRLTILIYNVHAREVVLRLTTWHSHRQAVIKEEVRRLKDKAAAANPAFTLNACSHIACVYIYRRRSAHMLHSTILIAFGHMSSHIEIFYRPELPPLDGCLGTHLLDREELSRRAFGHSIQNVQLRCILLHAELVECQHKRQINLLPSSAHAPMRGRTLLQSDRHS